ncbi:phosphatidylinositol-glycan biosynthesis class W protein [Trichonephila clavipes]|uniref:Phosphatidylinositol-glycan biosynthesis class W protein n=1 Tax=Trichonephila clavipes TaxID=2585209 RepID=A0A8X6W2R7_TRICX|nr:phosphatidylinositol-glycan biosynthesis class W protein [Trichonephila clavipes]
MLLRKWRSNSKQLNLLWQQEGVKTESSETSAIDLRPPTKVLGLAWDSENDLIYFDPKDLLKFMSRRGELKRFILSVVGRIFDPIGILGPFVIKLKYASKSAYGTILYLRFVTCNNEIETSFICSKSRVAPLKSLTLPCLELTAALLSARLAKQVSSCLKFDANIYYWTDSLISYYWISGVSATLTQLRKKYWIPKGRQLVKTMIRICFVCKKYSAKPADQLSGQLPRDRITQSPPFQVVGIDFTGAILVKDNQGTRKSYVSLFTCAVTRAVHLELVSDMSTKCFLLALRRFLARRGNCKVIYSDNAHTFKAAKRELAYFANILKDSEFQSFVADKGIHWKFIVECAPWWGGFYERLVKTIKDPLHKILGRALLTFEEFSTILSEVEVIVNHRPLTYVENDPGEPEPLTPAHFLELGYGDSKYPIHFIELIDTTTAKESYKKRKTYRTLLLKQLWRRWKEQYLLQLKTANHFKTPSVHKNLKLNDVVLVEGNMICYSVLCKVRLPSGLLAALTVLIHQLLLSKAGLADLVISDSRENFFEANKEGICSLLGFVTLYFCGVQLGHIVWQQGRKISDYIWLLVKLIVIGAFSWTLMYPFHEAVQPVSRRMANLPYCIWVVALTTLQLAVHLCQEIIMTILSKVLKNNCEFLLWKAINYNGLFYFLLANLLTGYKTISYEAVFAISGIPPIDLVILNNLDVRENYLSTSLECKTVCFRDGSKLIERVGLACVIYDEGVENVTFRHRLREECSVFQAELLYINLVVTLIQDSLRQGGTLNFLICNDSLSSLYCLLSINPTEKLVVEVQFILYYLDCDIHFSYVWGHSGNLGNDRADQYAKEATCQNMNLFMSVSLSYWKHVAWEITVSSWNNEFLASPKALWTKRFFPTIYQWLKCKKFATDFIPDSNRTWKF